MTNALVLADGLGGPAGAAYLQLFHSIGTDSDGNVNAWRTWQGTTASIASNVMTIPGNSAMSAGHLDWWDGYINVRFRWVTGAIANVGWHADRRVQTGDYNTVYLYVDGANLTIVKHLFGSGVWPAVAQIPATLVNNTWYWLRLSSVGTTYTAGIYADTAGVQGSLLTSTSGTITDPILQSGCIWLGSNNSGSIDFGGAFGGVCKVFGPGPLGWQANQGTGEPAWCWSSGKAIGSPRSLSVYNGAANAQAWWQSPAFQAVAGVPYTVTAQAQAAVGSLPANFYPAIDFGGGAVNGPIDGSWHQASNTSTPGGGSHVVDLISYGAGTFYWDEMAVYQGNSLPSPTLPVFSVPADTRYGKRQVVQFGGLPLPTVGGIQSFIDLMDGVNWFLDEKQFGIHVNIDHKLTSSPYAWRGKSAYLSEDYWPAMIMIPLLFDETNGITFQQARGALFMSGTQYLTFDGVTGLQAKLNLIKNIRQRITAQPYLWEGQLEFVGYEPWWKDFNQSTMLPLALAGAAGPGATTVFGIQNLGNVWAEPVFTLDIPAANASPVRFFSLTNNSNINNVESLSVSLPVPLAAGTHWILTIDCGAFTVTDQTGAQYDFNGSFPLLYPPAGSVNMFTATVGASGATSGVTLAAAWTHRWVP